MEPYEIAEILTYTAFDLSWYSDIGELPQAIKNAAEDLEKIKNSSLWYLLEDLAYQNEDILKSDFCKNIKANFAKEEAERKAEESEKKTKKIRTIKNAVDHGKYSIWLTGSKEEIRRNVYSKEGKYFIVYYGQEVEVWRAYAMGFATVEKF